jgi:hypothetical protein
MMDEIARYNREHFTSVAPPWLAFWAVYQPEIFGK